MLEKIDNTDEKLVIGRDDAIALLNHLKAGGPIPDLSFDAGDLREILEDDESIEVTWRFSFEATIRALSEEDAQAKLREILDDRRLQSQIETVIYEAIRERASIEGEADIAALNLDDYDID